MHCVWKLWMQCVKRDVTLSRIGFQRTSFSWAPRTPRTPSSTQCSPPLGTARVDLPSCRNRWLVFPRVSSHNGDWGNRWKPLHLQYYECYKLGVGGTFPGEIRSDTQLVTCLKSPSSGCSASPYSVMNLTSSVGSMVRKHTSNHCSSTYCRWQKIIKRNSLRLPL